MDQKTVNLTGTMSQDSAWALARRQHLDVMFRGKPLDDLTRDEALEALRQALTELKRLNSNYLPPGLLF